MRRGDIVVLPDDLATQIAAHAKTGYPEEVCGGLLGVLDPDGTVAIREAIAVENDRSDERKTRYSIGPHDVARLERRAREGGAELVGYYHSHPNAPPSPSEYDRAHAWPWYVYVIAQVSDGRSTALRAWRLLEDRGDFEELAIQNQDGEGPHTLCADESTSGEAAS